MSHWCGYFSDSLLDVADENGASGSFLWLPTRVRLRDSAVLLSPKTWGPMTPGLCVVWPWCWRNLHRAMIKKVLSEFLLLLSMPVPGHGLCLSHPLFARGPRSVVLGAFAFQEQQWLLPGKAQEPARGRQLWGNLLPKKLRGLHLLQLIFAHCFLFMWIIFLSTEMSGPLFESLSSSF